MVGVVAAECTRWHRNAPASFKRTARLWVINGALGGGGVGDSLSSC